MSKLHYWNVIASLQILHLIPYSQKRKRMSVVVQHPDGSIFVYCKGADSVLMERLCETSSNAARPLPISGDNDIGEGIGNAIDPNFPEAEALSSGNIVESTRAILSHWGSDGFRTLCFAYKEISQQDLRVCVCVNAPLPCM